MVNVHKLTKRRLRYVNSIRQTNNSLLDIALSRKYDELPLPIGVNMSLPSQSLENCFQL